MLFGIREVFAIEAMSEPALQPPSAVWGRMQLWCQGISIGDFSDEYCALYGSYLGFKTLSQCLPGLWKPEFDSLSDVALWNRLDELLYGFHGDIQLEDNRSVEECREDLENYAMFDFLTNWGEQFDRGGKSFIFCTPTNEVLILNRHLPPGKGLSMKAPLTDVAPAIQGFLTWFEQEAARLGHPVS